MLFTCIAFSLIAQVTTTDSEVILKRGITAQIEDADTMDGDTTINYWKMKGEPTITVTVIASTVSDSASIDIVVSPDGTNWATHPSALRDTITADGTYVIRVVNTEFLYMGLKYYGLNAGTKGDRDAYIYAPLE